MGSDFNKIFQARGVEPKTTSADSPKVENQQPAKRRSKGKRSDSNFTQVSAYIPKTLHKKVKIELMDSQQDFSDLVTTLLSNWLEEQ